MRAIMTLSFIFFSVIFMPKTWAEESDFEFKTVTPEERQKYRPLRFGGHVYQKSSQLIHSPISGQVVEILVKDGQTVKAGELLMLVHDRGPWQKLPHQLTAPEAGRINRILVSPQQHLAANQAVISLAVDQQEDYELKVHASLEDVLHMKIGETMLINISIGGNSEPVNLQGRINGIAHQMDPSTASYPVTMALNCPRADQHCRRILSFHTYASATYEKPIGKSLHIPRSALQWRRDRVYVLRDDKVVEQKVTIGRRAKDEVEILSGLETDDVVIVTASRQPQDQELVDLAKGLHSKRADNKLLY